MSRTQDFLSVIAILVAARGGMAQDAHLVPGDLFEGRIAFAGDEDLVTFATLSGVKLTVRARALPGAKVRPRVELRSGGAPMTIPSGLSSLKKSGKRHRLRQVPIDQDGEIEVIVRGAGKKLGSYELLVKEVFPDAKQKKLVVDSGATKNVPFVARAGATVTITLTGRKKGPSLMTPSVRAPSGAALSLTGLVVSEDEGRRLEIGPLPIGEDGTHLVEVTGSTPSEKVKIKVELSLVAPTGALIVEDPGAATITGSISILDGTWLPGPGGGSSQSFQDDEILAKLMPGADADLAAQELGAEVIGRAPNGWVRMRLVGAPAVSLATQRVGAARRVKQMLRSARKLDGVIEVQANHRRKSFAPPNDPLHLEQWALPICGFELAWEVEDGDPQRSVAVLDTGVRPEHPDLSGQLLSGYDFVSDGWNAGDGDGMDGNPRDEFVSLGTHGTHVTGSVAARVNNGIGIAGGAVDIKVMPVRVLGVLGGTDFDIAQGVLYAARLPNASNQLPSVAADVINMSLGGPNPSEILHQALRDAVEAGVVIVVAAGNAGNTIPMYPAAYPEVIAVSATDVVDQKADYSSYGPHVDLAAPGGDMKKDLNSDGELDGILSTIVHPIDGPTYGLKSGTSMAAPHVAAAAFLIRSAFPGLEVGLVRAILAASAVDLGDPGLDDCFGEGRLDVPAALAVASGTVGGAADLFIHPNPLRFGAHQEDLGLAIVNRGGGGPISVTGVTSDAFWVSPGATTGNSPCVLDFSVEKNGFAPGEYNGTITVETSVGDVNLPVEMVVDFDGPIPVGTVFVLVVDVETELVVRGVAVTEESADLFTLDQIPEGTYHIVASTDLDFDGVAGEFHDYAGVAVDPGSGQGLVALPDGATVSNVTLELASGTAKSLPGGGYLVIPGEL